MREGIPIIVSLVKARGSRNASGELPLNIIYSGAIATSSDNIDAIESSLAVATEILTRGGIQPRFNYLSLRELPNILPNPSLGDPLYLETATEAEERLNLYFGVDVDSLKSPLNRLGQSGSIPGPLVPTTRSAIAYSVSQAAGDDGVFDSDEDERQSDHTSEIRLFGEVIAHEILHYIALVDTVTFQGGTVVNSDVTDSEKCITLDECEDEGDAAQNIMFPFPIEQDQDFGGRDEDSEEFLPRQYFSSDQIEIIASSPAMR